MTASNGSYESIFDALDQCFRSMFGKKKGKERERDCLDEFCKKIQFFYKKLMNYSGKNRIDHESHVITPELL